MSKYKCPNCDSLHLHVILPTTYQLEQPNEGKPYPGEQVTKGVWGGINPTVVCQTCANEGNMAEFKQEPYTVILKYSDGIHSASERYLVANVEANNTANAYRMAQAKAIALDPDGQANDYALVMALEAENFIDLES